MTKTLNLNVNGRTYVADIGPDGFGYYEYSLYEVIPKKHWWSSGKHYIGHGTIWSDIRAEIEARIHDVIALQKSHDSLDKQFEEL